MPQNAQNENGMAKNDSAPINGVDLEGDWLE